MEKPRLIKFLTSTVLLTLALSGPALAQLTPAQQSARDKGIALYQQSDWYDSQPLLQTAAEAGDAQAQYYLGEALRLSNRYSTPQARKWYEAAARQGHLYAMLRLGNADDFCQYLGDCDGENDVQWRKVATEQAYARAQQGDTEAMTVLFITRHDLGWLQMAAEAGDSRAQEWLAGIYKDGGGWYVIPALGEMAARKWYKASAEGGNPKGMFLYASLLYDNNGDTREIGHWLEQAAEGGHIDSVATYASELSEQPNRFGHPHDLVKAYGLTYLVAHLEGGGNSPREAKLTLEEIAAKMTPAQIEQGLAFAKGWERTHPPLSYYDPIYGY